MTERILTWLQETRGAAGEERLPSMRFAAERSVAMMKAYCGIETLPEELLGVGVSLAGWLLDSGMGVVEGSGGAKSIKEGDVTVTFAENGFGVQATEQEMLAYFAVELDRFRRMDW